MDFLFPPTVDWSQKLSMFCLLFGAHKEAAKVRIQNGESVELVLNEMFLLVTSELCRTLSRASSFNYSDWSQHFDLLAANEEKMAGLNNQQAADQMDETSEGSPSEDDEASQFEEDEAEEEKEQPRPKQFVCKFPSCGKSYIRNDTLKKHEIVHKTPDRYYGCTWTGCTFTSKYSSSVMEHVGRNHLKYETRGPNKEDYQGEARAYVRTIFSNGNEPVPLSSGDGPGPFRCMQLGCGRKFAKKGNLLKHNIQCQAATLKPKLADYNSAEGTTGPTGDENASPNSELDTSTL